MENKKINKKLKKAVHIAVLCFAVFCVISQPVTDDAEAIVCGGLCIAGVALASACVGGWIVSKLGDDGNNPNQEAHEEALHHEYFVERVQEINDMYNMSKVQDSNLRNLFDNTYLSCVRYVENEVANFVHYDNWQEVKANMTAFRDFNTTARSILLNLMGSVGYADNLVLKYFLQANQFDFCDLKVDGSPASIFNWGIQLYDNEYNGGYIGDYYLNYIMIPNGEWCIVDGTNYSGDGIDRIVSFSSGDLTNILDGGCITSYNITKISDEDKVYINGVRCNYPYYSAFDNPIGNMWRSCDHDQVNDDSAGNAVWVDNAMDGVSVWNETNAHFSLPEWFILSMEQWGAFQCSKMRYIDNNDVADPTKITVKTSYDGDVWATVKDNMTITSNGNWQDFTIPQQYVKYVKVEVYETENPSYMVFGGGSGLFDVYVDGRMFYRRDDGYNVTLDYDNQDDFYLDDCFPDRVSEYWSYWSESLHDIYDAMNGAGYAQWYMYKTSGYESVDDIPSDELVPYPDFYMSNIDSLEGLNQSEYFFIYYNMLAQLNESSLWSNNNERLDALDFNITDNFADYMINCTLVHSGSEVFNHSLCWVSVLHDDLNISAGETVTLSQKIMFYDTVTNKLYFGYSGDNLTVHEILYKGNSINNTTLTITTLENLATNTYGITLTGGFQSSLSEFFAYLGEHSLETYSIVVSAVAGVACLFLGSSKQELKFLKTVGVLLIVVAVVIALYLFVYPYIEPIIEALGGLF